MSKSISEGEGQAYGMALLKQDGGTYTYSSQKLSKIKKFGYKVIKLIQKFYGNLPQLNIRVDTGTTSDGKIFLNEIEFAGSFFPSWFRNKSKLTIDVSLSEQIMKIVRQIKTNRLKLPYKSGNKPSLKNLKTSKQVKAISLASSSKSYIYLLGCYKQLCNKKVNLKNRLKFIYYYFNQARIPLNSVKPVGIFWKEDLNRKKLIKNDTYKNTYQMMRNGEIGNILSHSLALKKFLNTNNKWCIILEDDAWVKYDFKYKINSVIKRMKNKKWDIIWLHNNGWHEYTKNWENEFNNLNNAFTKRRPTKFTNPIKITNNLKLYKMNKNFVGSTAAYIITRNGAKQYLKKMFPIGEKPTDVFMQTQNKNIIQYSTGGAKRLSNETWEGDFVWSDTDTSVIQL